MKKRSVAIALVLLTIIVCLPSLPVSASAANSGVTINVYNWAQYISDGSDGYLDVNAAFTKATGIKVNYMTYDTNESLYTKLRTGGTTYDVIVPSDYMVARLIEEDMLEPLDFNKIPNYQYIDNQFKNQSFDPQNTYSVPYTWGTVGIIYNKKYVKKEVTGWDILWDKDYAGKILMFDNPRDSFAIAEKRLGYSLNTTNPTELQAAADLLKGQKPLVQSYVMDQIFDAMEREEAWIAPYYAGDYLMMAEENQDLAFCFPKEGFNVFIDALCIPKGCQNKEAAEAYINFLCNPEICGQNLEYLGYSTPSTASKEYMDEEVSSSPIAYPNKETLSRSEAFTYLNADTSQLMDNLWLEVKTAGNVSAYLMGGGAAVLVVVACLLLFTFRRKHRLAVRRALCKKYYR